MGIKNILKKIYFKLNFWWMKINFFGEKYVATIITQKVSDNKKKYAEGIEKLPIQITEVYGDREGIITVVSDDGFLSSGMILNELLKKHNLRATVAGAVKFVKPNLKEWKRILAEGHIEMVSHSYRHIALKEGSEISRDKDRLYYEIVGSTKWHEKKFPECGKQIAFVCPEGEMCKLGNEVINESGFYAVRSTIPGYNSLSPKEGTEIGEWFRLKVQGVADQNVNIDVRNSWVNNAADKRLWLIEMWHNVMEQDDGYFQTILKGDADEHLKYISKMQEEGRIWVATLLEATKYIRERQMTDVEAYMLDDVIYVKASLKRNSLPESKFTQPLTVKIEVPNAMKQREFYLDDTLLIVSKDNNLLINIVPDGKIIKLYPCEPSL